MGGCLLPTTVSQSWPCYDAKQVYRIEVIDVAIHKYLFVLSRHNTGEQNEVLLAPPINREDAAGSWASIPGDRGTRFSMRGHNINTPHSLTHSLTHSLKHAFFSVENCHARVFFWPFKKNLSIKITNFRALHAHLLNNAQYLTVLRCVRRALPTCQHFLPVAGISTITILTNFSHLIWCIKGSKCQNP